MSLLKKSLAFAIAVCATSATAVTDGSGPEGSALLKANSYEPYSWRKTVHPVLSSAPDIVDEKTYEKSVNMTGSLTTDMDQTHVEKAAEYYYSKHAPEVDTSDGDDSAEDATDTTETKDVESNDAESTDSDDLEDESFLQVREDKDEEEAKSIKRC